MAGSIDIAKLASELDSTESIGGGVGVILRFSEVSDGIGCSLYRCASCYSDEYPYGPVDGVDDCDLAFKFTVPAEECGDPKAWKKRGSEALGALDIEQALVATGYLDYFEEYIDDYGSDLDVERESTEHSMNPKDMLGVYAKFIALDLDTAVADVSEAVERIVREMKRGYV